MSSKIKFLVLLTVNEKNAQSGRGELNQQFKSLQLQLTQTRISIYLFMDSEGLNIKEFIG